MDKVEELVYLKPWGKLYGLIQITYNKSLTEVIRIKTVYYIGNYTQNYFNNQVLSYLQS